MTYSSSHLTRQIGHYNCNRDTSPPLANNRKTPNLQLNRTFLNPQAQSPMGAKSLNLLEDLRLDSISAYDRAYLYGYSAMAYAAANFRATMVSQVPMKIVRASNGELAPDGLFSRLFARQSKYADKMMRSEASFCFWGHNLLFKARNNFGIPVELQWMNPMSYMIDADANRGLQGFRVSNTPNKKDTGYYIKLEDAVFMHSIDFLDDFQGVSPGEAAFQAASADTEISQTIYATFRNMAVPALFVQPTADSQSSATKEKADMLTRLFRNIVQGAQNAGRTIISPQRWEFQTLQPPFRDMDMQSLSSHSREQVCIAFGVPYELLFPSASNYAQYEGVRRTWAHAWLVPHMWWYADAFTDSLSDEYQGIYVVEPNFDKVPFLKEDADTQINRVNAKLQAGLITYGEAQKQLGEPVIPETEHMVYSAVLNAPIPKDVLSELYKTLNGALSPEIQPASTPSALDDSVTLFPERPTVEDLTSSIGNKSWIPDEQYNELRAWKKKASDNRAYDFKPTFLRQDVVEFVERHLQDADDELELIFANAKTWLGQKSIQSTRLDFESDFEGILEEARKSGLARRRFGTLIRAIIAKYGRRAYRDGLIDGGVEDGEMDAEDYQQVDTLIAQQSQYVTNLGDTLYDKGVSDAQAYGKPAMWFNKTLMPMYLAGLESADKNALYEWVLGNTEQHCKDCLMLNGQKHRMKEYTKRGWVPQANQLECKGFKCDCKFQRTTGRAKGRFPTPSATKHTHGLYDPENLLTPEYSQKDSPAHV